MRMHAFVNDGDDRMWKFTPGDVLDHAGEFRVGDTADTEAALEELWTIGNRMGSDRDGKTWSPDVRSMCTGDVVVITDRWPFEAWVVDSVGFRRLDPQPGLALSLAGPRSHRCLAVRRDGQGVAT